MSNDETRMRNGRSLNSECERDCYHLFAIGALSFLRHSGFVIRHCPRSPSEIHAIMRRVGWSATRNRDWHLLVMAARLTSSLAGAYNAVIVRRLLRHA